MKAAKISKSEKTFKKSDIPNTGEMSERELKIKTTKHISL